MHAQTFEGPAFERAEQLKSQPVELIAEILALTMKSSGRPMSLFAQTTISGGRRLFRRWASDFMGLIDWSLSDLAPGFCREKSRILGAWYGLAGQSKEWVPRAAAGLS